MDGEVVTDAGRRRQRAVDRRSNIGDVRDDIGDRTVRVVVRLMRRRIWPSDKPTENNALSAMRPDTSNTHGSVEAT